MGHAFGLVLVPGVVTLGLLSAAQIGWAPVLFLPLILLAALLGAIGPGQPSPGGFTMLMLLLAVVLIWMSRVSIFLRQGRLANAPNLWPLVGLLVGGLLGSLTLGSAGLGLGLLLGSALGTWCPAQRGGRRVSWSLWLAEAVRLWAVSILVLWLIFRLT